MLNKTIDFTSDSGIDIKSAYMCFNGAQVFSHSVTIEEVTENKLTIEVSVSIYAAKSAYSEGRPKVQDKVYVMEYDPSYSLEDIFMSIP